MQSSHDLAVISLGIYQAFLACAPGAALMRRAIDLVVDHVEARWYPAGQPLRQDGSWDWPVVLNITGPSMLGGAANLEMGRGFELGCTRWRIWRETDSYARLFRALQEAAVACVCPMATRHLAQPSVSPV